MKSLIKYFIVAFIFLFSLTSAFSQIVLKGSGNVISEDRKVAMFHTVKFNCMGYVIIKDGTPGKITVTTDDNIMAHVSAVVDKGELKITLTKLVKEATKLQIEVYMDSINGLYVDGSGKIELQKKVLAENLKLYVSGSGNIIADIETKYVYANIVGSGSIDLYGKTIKSEVDISGSSTFNGLNLISENALIFVGGNSVCKINTEKVMEIDFKGGKVIYKGTPKIKLKASISGSLEYLE